MTLRPLPRSRLDGLVPSLVQEHALVALVAGTGEDRWAADAAWAVARAARAGGRRVALVDLSMEEPQLFRGAGVAPDAAGIVDVFERNAELNSVAHDVGGVFFIPAGARTAAPEFVLAHPRWRKLHAGFRAERALLLAYVPAGALASLSVIPDGVIVLAPGGFDLESPVARDVRAAQVDGAMLLGVVRDRWTPPPTAAIQDEEWAPMPEAPARPARPSGRGRRVAIAAGALVVLGGGAAGMVLLRSRAAPSPTPEAPAIRAAAPVERPADPVPEPPAPVAAADTLAWVIQLAAYANVANALTHATELRAGGTEAVVAPVTAGSGAAVWYRVLAGGWGDQARAIAGRDSLWSRGVARRGQGELVRAPLTLVPRVRNSDSTALLRRGIPVVLSGGRLAVGAFESAEQAAYARELLTRAGVPADLVHRRERTP